MTKSDKIDSEVHKQGIEILSPPVKGEKDTKEYRTIRLSNGLVVCLVSDIKPNEDALSSSQIISDDEEDDQDDQDESGEEAEDEDMKDDESGDEESDDIDGDAHKMAKTHPKEGKQKMAACALCVNVGSFHDPLHIPGLAHFLEHMVFMGSTKFPSENHFDSYITRRGGADNASTDCEYTTFYFECLERYLLPAMDKFAQFFVSPLMKRASMQREREAIESEFQAALPSDAYRREQLLSNIMCGVGGTVSSFAWGNMHTLKERITDDELYEQLHAFRKQHYSAHRMTIAVQSRHSLDSLEQYVLSSFSDVPNNNLPAPDLTQQTPPDSIHPVQLWNRIYHVAPVRACHRIDLSFSLPPLQRYYRQKPLEYVGWLLGGEGRGSLMSLLKGRNWALSIEAGNSGEGTEDNVFYTLLSVSVVLTEEGLEHWREVVEVLMGYVSLMRKETPQERLHNEMAQIAEVRFRFAEEIDPTDNVEQLVESMHLYQPEDYFTGSELHLEYCPETINMVMTYLRADNMNIMISTSNEIDGVLNDLEEKWFKTKYSIHEIPIEWMKRWSSAEPHVDLHLPLPNNFLTTNFDLLQKESHCVKRSLLKVLPKLIIESPSIELWFKLDTQFHTPHVSYTFYLMNPICIENAENNCMLEIMREMLHQELNEETYPAIIADLLYEFKLSEMGLQLQLFGYNQKLPELLELISNYLRDLPNQLNPDLFKSVKVQQQYNYFNRAIKPSHMTKDIRLSILMPSYYTSLEKHRILETITIDKLRQFIVSYLDKLYIQGLICGNIQEEDAILIGERLLKTLNYTPIPKQIVLKKEVKQLSKGKRCCRVKSLNEHDSNTYITHYFQKGPGNLKDSVFIQLLMCIIEEPLFDTLRTKEQLGYNVYALLRDTQSVLGMSITVQTRTNKATASHVDRRISAFITYIYKKLLRNMSPKRFMAVKGDLIKVKLCEDTHLREEVNKLWDEIETGQYMFDRIEREMEVIEKVKLGELLQFWGGLTGARADLKEYKWLIVQVVGHEKDNTEKTTPTEDVVKNCALNLEFLGAEDGEEEFHPDGYFICDIAVFKKGLVSFEQENNAEMQK